jgi:mycolipenoyl-CoA---2-(long-chain-fatty acyl)-trehalose mycolipenoyltransferase / long-chain-acyl-CoA---trehalose acyltransferase
VVVVGQVEVGPIHHWQPTAGSVVSWHASPASLEKARQAPKSAVPASYQQAQHIRRFCENASHGIDMSRLLTAGWDIPGQCDIRAMTHVINTHLRRHDTYHSWFEFEDDDRIVRRTISEPAQIKYAPIKHGEMTAPEVRSLALGTPNPLRWDSVRFLIIQRADHFTFCVCVDHLHIDAMFVGVGFMEIHLMYAALAAGRAPVSLPPAGSYDDYCIRQGRALSALTVESPPVRAWVDFFEDNNGTLPEFPLPLGDPGQSVPCDMMSVQLLDERQTARFESACLAAGARFSGGVFACAALAQYELTGADTYYGLIAHDTRSTLEFMTVGWFTGFVPITVPVYASSFGDTARTAQESFDSGKDLANVPFNRVLELAPWLGMPQQRVPLLFHLDTSSPLLSTIVNADWSVSSMKVYHDGRVPARFDLRVNRYEKETHVVVFFPNNPIARESVTRYIETLKSIYARVAEGRGATVPLRNGARFQRQLV